MKEVCCMQKVKEACIEYFWLFVVGSIFGFFYEMILEFFRNGTLGMHKGLLYGPFCQVYGIGLVTMVLLFRKIKKPIQLVVGGFIAGGVLEYLLSYIQEIVFHSKSWDYSNYPLNFDGRTSIFHMCFWALFVVFVMHYIYPHLKEKLRLFQTNIGKWITLCCFLLLFADVALSIAATIRYRDRNEGIVASNPVEIFLDNTYTNERIESIYRMSVPSKPKG